MATILNHIYSEVITINYQNFLKGFADPNTATRLITAIDSAYMMVDNLAKSVDFLSSELAPQYIPHLKNAAVEYELVRRANEGSLPFECSVVQNTQKSHKHVELRRNNWVLTVSQIKSPSIVPKDAIFRNEYSTNGQIALKEFECLEGSKSGELYAIITHGWQSIVPKFICCGILNPSMKYWDHQCNLHDFAYFKIIDDSPVTKEIELGFVEKIEEVISNA